MSNKETEREKIVDETHELQDIESDEVEEIDEDGLKKTT